MMDIKRKPEIEQMLKDALTKMDAYKYRALFDRLKGEG